MSNVIVTVLPNELFDFKDRSVKIDDRPRNHEAMFTTLI